jgi:hypothetical protein
MDLIDELLGELKDKLQVTWDDEPTNRNFKRIISSSINYFNELCDIEFAFDEYSTERELLMERCRYIWNNSLEDFETNFLQELSRLILKAAVDSYIPEVSTDGSGTSS